MCCGPPVQSCLHPTWKRFIATSTTAFIGLPRRNAPAEHHTRPGLLSPAYPSLRDLSEGTYFAITPLRPVLVPWRRWATPDLHAAPLNAVAVKSIPYRLS